MAARYRRPVKLVDGAICVEPGLYELLADINVPRTNFKDINDGDFWLAGQRYFIQEHTDKIGDQPPYTYYSIQKLGSIRGHGRIKSYEIERWNTVVTSLVRLDN